MTPEGKNDLNDSRSYWDPNLRIWVRHRHTKTWCADCREKEKTKEAIKQREAVLRILEAPFGPGLVEAAREPGQTHTVEEWKELLRQEIREPGKPTRKEGKV